MTVIDFVAEITSMYGEFTSEGMKKAVMNRISALSDSQRDKLFETYIRSIPGTYKPDLKNVLDCMDKAAIKIEHKKTCKSCGYEWNGTSYTCLKCGYDSDYGDPKEYAYHYNKGDLFVKPELVSDLMSSLRFRSVE